MEWMLGAMAVWRQGLIAVTIYATLGEEGALHSINQARSNTVLADAKLLKILVKIAKDCVHLKTIITITDEVEPALVAKLPSHITVHSMSHGGGAWTGSPARAHTSEPHGGCCRLDVHARQLR